MLGTNLNANQGVFNLFPTPVYFPIFPAGGGYKVFAWRGLGLQGFGRKTPKNDTEGDVLENLSDFSENLNLNTSIKQAVGYIGFRKMLVCFSKFVS